MKPFNFARCLVHALASIVSTVVLMVGALPLEARAANEPTSEQASDSTGKQAGEHSGPEPVRREPRIGLVLGGGGARGAAHIGVLKVLEREHIPIHAIAGTSVGAVIGGLYAAGYSPDEIEKAVTSVDWADIFRDVTSRPLLPMRQKETDLGILANLEVGVVEGQLTVPTTLVRGQKLGLFLRRMFLGRSNVASFDDLPIPFRCVATDIGIVKPVVFSSGDLELAIRASMAVPGAFAPVQHEGKVLVDGGIVDNLPVDIARQMNVDYVIVVDVGQPLAPGNEVTSGVSILLQMVSGMMRDRTEQSIQTLGTDDVLLRPDLGNFTSLSFLDAAKGVPPGEAAATAALDKLRHFSMPEDKYLAWQDSQRRRPAGSPRIEFVKVIDDLSKTSGYVRDRIRIKAGEPLDLDALEQEIGGAYGRGTYDSINYRLAENEKGETGLEVLPLDSTLGRTVFRVGFQVNDDFQGHDDYQLNIESRITGLNSKGAEWRAFAGLGRVAALSTDLYVPFGGRGLWFIDPGVSYSALTQPIITDDVHLADYRVQSWTGAARVGRDLGDRLRISVGYVRGQDYAKRLVGDPVLPGPIRADIGGLEANILWDSLDNVRFPRHGTRAELTYGSYSGVDASSGGNLLRFSLDSAYTFGANTVMLGARTSLEKNRVDAFQTQSSLGGLAFLSGLGDRELIDDQQVFVRTIFYRRLNPQKTLLFDVPLYLAGSLEAGNVWSTFDEVKLNDMIGAGSVFLGIDLPIGPLQLGYGHTFDNRSAFYLTFGSLVLPRYR